MKTPAHSLLILSLLALLTATALASTVHSIYIGPEGGNWSDPANWSPAIVPDNTGSKSFNVSVGAADPAVTLDIDVTITSLRLGPATFVGSSDHNLTSSGTTLGSNPSADGDLYFSAESTSVLANLGKLTEFSGTELQSGTLEVDTTFGEPGLTATIQFNGADIRINSGALGIYGPNSQIVDEQGSNALSSFQHNLLPGILDIETGTSVTTGASVVNEGSIFIITKFAGIEGPDVLTVKGDYTSIGYPLDAGTIGLNEILAAGPSDDAEMLIDGSLTNYDTNTKTLSKSYWAWAAANGAAATTQVRGGAKPMDIVTSQAALNLYGPNTGFRDKLGNDALRNLSSSARFLIGNRDFTTVGSFNSSSRLGIFGGTDFTVTRDLTVQSGFVEVSPLTGYARVGNDQFPLDPLYLNSNLTIKRNFHLPAGSILRPHILDTSTTATVMVNGTAFLTGSLEVSLEDAADISASDSFTVLTAKTIVGKFSNIPSGGTLTIYSGVDGTNGQNTGDPIGTFLVTYDNTKVVLSDFQPITNAAGQANVHHGVSGR